ncbi:acetyl esterase/lipase [Sphingobium fontiphilum]|uniref:Acetyl esterase/lipase n=1 Tax=Sphingobium fontiphilum TaxID=944425 RepID=A0A7W6DL06_9SPHN|nr:prolyl oligopeptidase family serine peptidase [Sphingobium fontiphilum]MBB3982527.1 acetyl esterase/lipase [Sphingobium fontiphilum]
MKIVAGLLAGIAAIGCEAAIAQTSPDGATPQAAASAAPAAAPQWKLEDFAALPLMDAPILSPDGLHLATRVAVDGVQKLVIADIAEGPNRIRTLGLGENDLNWWRWVNDEWLIVGVGAEATVEGMPWYISRVASVNRDGAKSYLLAKNVAAQNADDVIWVAQDGSPRILLSYQTSIYSNMKGFWPQVDEVDVTTGRMRTIVASHDYVHGWYADAAGVVRMGVGYVDSSRTAKLLYRPDSKTAFRVVDRADRKRDESLIVPQLFSADPTRAIAYDDRDGADDLYEFNLQTLELGNKIFSMPGFDLGGIIPDSSGSALAGVRYIADAPGVHWFDANIAKIQADLDKAVGDRRARIVSSSRDKQRLIVLVDRPDLPGAYYYYDTSGGVMNFLSAVNGRFRGKARLSPVKTIRYKARDGLEIAAVLTLPSGRDAQKLPMILLPHGGPFARDYESWDWWAQFLAWRGYAVLQPNYRGSSGYGTAFAEKGEGQWGLAMQDDLDDAVDWAVAQGIADAGRVCIAGASYGGYAAMRAAQRNGDKYRCAISYAGVSDLAAMMRYDRRFLNSGTRRDWMKEQAPDFAAVSPINFAAQFSTPILLMHGKKDRRVRVDQSRKMAEKLKAAGKAEGRDYIYVEQPEADHHFSREADRLEFLQRMDAFLKDHNPA